MSTRLIKERTGEDVDTWNRRIKRERLRDEKSLRAWLTNEGVTGYAQSLFVMERFGYPGRPQIRPIFDVIIDAAAGLGEVIIRTHKT